VLRRRILMATLLACSVAAAAEVGDRTGIMRRREIPVATRTETAVFLELPHIRQEPWLCVPTAAAMVLSYYGDPQSPRKLKLLSRGQAYDPAEPFDDFTFTWWRDLVAGLRGLGYGWRETGFSNDERGFRAGLEAIRASLREGDPVLLDVALYKSHTFVVVGFDDERQLVYINDPNLPAPGLRRLSYEQLESIWNGLSYDVDARPALFTRNKHAPE